MGEQATSVALSAVAVVVSLVSLYAGRRKDRREAFLRLHESLISSDLQSGRRVLFALHARAGRVEDLNEEEYASANRALSSFDVAGLYCHKGYVREKDVLELWAPSLVKMKYAGALFLQHRDSFWSGIPTWPHYRRLADDAEAYLRSRGVDIDRFAAPAPGLPQSRTSPS
ncbi:hypothetical protein ACWEHT_10140 [Streptomyces sp. NPDC004646]